jgi:hypothetical protein
MSGTHFQYEFSRDVSFVIGLPYLVMFLGMPDMGNIICIWDLLI